MDSKFILLCLLFITMETVGLRHSRNLGLLPSFDDDLNVPEDSFQDILDDHDGVGTDIPVLGDGFMLFGKPVNYLKCWDQGACYCDPATPISGTLDVDYPGNANGLYFPENTCILSPNWITIDAAKSYHVAWRKVDSEHVNTVKDIDRINSEVNRAQHLYTETWNATKAVIITWIITELANTANVDKFQAVLALGTRGGVSETYIIYLYQSVGNVPDSDPKMGYVLGYYPAANRRFARVCPSDTTDTLAPSSDFVSNSNRKCGHPGIYVFKTTEESDACTNEVTACVDNAGVNKNCNQSSVPVDTCTESYRCNVDENDPTQVTLIIVLRWYKFGTLTALDYSDFVAEDETNPNGPQTLVSTPPKCTKSLANPGMSTASDTYSVTMALATPECGVEINITEETLSFAFKIYEALHEEEDRDGDLILYGTCHFNGLQNEVSANIINDGTEVSEVPGRQRVTEFNVLDSGAMLDSEILSFVKIGQSFSLGICYRGPVIRPFDETTCDFEQGLCSWANAQQGDDFDWSLFQGSTPTRWSGYDTGPSVDHTLSTASGYYIYIETSTPAEGDTARLNSEVFQSTGTAACFSFYYHMYGATIGALNIYVLVIDTITELLVWSLNGDMGDQWQLGQFSVYLPTSSMFQIIIEGVHGSSFTGDIAIDDTSLIDGACQQIPSASVTEESAAVAGPVTLDEPTPMNVNADAYGIHVTSCTVANDASFINDSPGPGPRRSVTFISGGCPVSADSQGPLSLKRSFEADLDVANISEPVWCVTTGPIVAGRWSKKPDSANDKLHFQCVIGFCTIVDTTDLCHDSCPSDPITRRKRDTGTEAGNSPEFTKTLYTSVQLIDTEVTAVTTERCTNMTTVASVLACLLLVLGIASAVCVVLYARLTRERRKGSTIRKERKLDRY